MESRFEVNFDMKNVNTVIELDASKFAETDEAGKLFGLKKFIAGKFIDGIGAISDEEIDTLVTINSSEEVTKKNFRVDMDVRASCSIEVEAFDEESAEEIAIDIADSDYNNLYDLDYYDWTVSSVYSDE